MIEIGLAMLPKPSQPDVARSFRTVNIDQIIPYIKTAYDPRLP